MVGTSPQTNIPFRTAFSQNIEYSFHQIDKYSNASL